VIDDARSEAGTMSEVRAACWTVVLTEWREWGRDAQGEGGRCRQLSVHSRFTRDQMTWHLDDYCCTLLRGILKSSFQETSPRNTAKNIVKHRGGGVGSVVANHRGGGETSMVITTLMSISVQACSVQKYVVFR